MSGFVTNEAGDEETSRHCKQAEINLDTRYHQIQLTRGWMMMLTLTVKLLMGFVLVSPAQREISLQPTILPARLICQNYFIHTRWWEVDNIIIILQWFVIHLFELRESH